MTLSARRLAAAAATTLFATVLTALPQLPGAAAETLTLDGAPAVGECYDVSRRTAYEADVLEVATVPCTEKHTLWVAGVVELPADVVETARASCDEVLAAVRAGAAPYDGAHARWLAELDRLR